MYRMRRCLHPGLFFLAVLAFTPVTVATECDLAAGMLAEDIVAQERVEKAYLHELDAEMIDDDALDINTPVRPSSHFDAGAYNHVHDYQTIEAATVCPNAGKTVDLHAVEEVIVIQAVENLIAALREHPEAIDELLDEMAVTEALRREVHLIKTGEKPLSVFSHEKGFKRLSRAFHALYGRPTPSTEIVYQDES